MDQVVTLFRASPVWARLAVALGLALLVFAASPGAARAASSNSPITPTIPAPAAHDSHYWGTDATCGGYGCHGDGCDSCHFVGPAPDITATQAGAPAPAGHVTLACADCHTVVGAVNTPPVLASIGNKTVNELSLLSFTATATDVDLPANTLAFSLGAGAPSGAAITSGGAFTWTPSEAQGPGSYPIAIVVSDGTAADSETITVTVNEVTSPTTIALEHDAAGVVFDRFVTGYSSSYSGGGYVYGRWTGTVLKASFTGSSIKWVGPKQPSYGMADVWVDGALVASNVDCYQAAPGTLTSTIWESAVLADGPHTIELRLTGNKNAASSGTVVVLDRFEVTGSSPSGLGTRYDDTAVAPGYTGTWLHYINATYYNQTYAYSRWTNAAFTASFTGTRVSWIGPRTQSYGMADVWIDGVKVATVDTYRASLATQGWREVVWTSSVLAPGAHTLSIRPTGTKNPGATAANIVIDAIDVTP